MPATPVTLTVANHGASDNVRGLRGSPKIVHSDCESAQGSSAAERMDMHLLLAGGSYANHSVVAPILLVQDATYLWIACAMEGYSSVTDGPTVAVFGEMPNFEGYVAPSTYSVNSPRSVSANWPALDSIWMPLLDDDGQSSFTLSPTAISQYTASPAMWLGAETSVRLRGAQRAIVVVTSAINASGTGESFIYGWVGT